MDDLEALVGDWLPLPDVAERLSVDVGRVRGMVQDRELLAARVGERRILCVPALLIGPEGPLLHLTGTLTVLADAGIEGDAALTWLFTPDESLAGGSPIGALHAGHKTEVRRRAQALAF